MSSGTFMYPNVTSLPGQSGVGQSDHRLPRKEQGAKGEFDHVLDKASAQPQAQPQSQSHVPEHGELGHVKAPLKFSAHASQRLKDRKIDMSPEMMAKVNDAIDKAAAKGVEESLVLTKDAALIVSVKNRTVITALDRHSMAGNVFTNIDGAVIV